MTARRELPGDRKRLAEQLRTRRPEPACIPEYVICCGHSMDVHDDDGCQVGWEPADTSDTTNGCPCRVRGWAR